MDNGYVTYENLFQFVIILISFVSLIYKIMNDRHK